MSGSTVAARVAVVAASILVAACRAISSPPDDFGGPGDVPAPNDAAAGVEPLADAATADVPATRAVPRRADVATPVGGSVPIGPPGVPVRLTDGGCCVRPMWRADSRALWFIDRSPDGVTGFFSASLDAPGAPTALVTTTIAAFSPDQRWRIDLASGRTTLVRLSDGAAFDVPAGGRSVAFSPDGARIAWQEGDANASFERQVARIVVASPDGSNRLEVARLAGGSLADWLGPDALLVRAREAADSDVDVLLRQPLDGGERVEVLRARRLRSLLLSPDKLRLAYTVSGAPDADANGLWLAATDGSSPPRKLDGLFGAYRWRDARRLVIVPFEMDAPSMRLIELDAATLAVRPLTDAAEQPLRIANGDWSVSPDGAHVAFVSAADRNIWTMAIPP